MSNTLINYHLFNVSYSLTNENINLMRISVSIKSSVQVVATSEQSGCVLSFTSDSLYSWNRGYLFSSPLSKLFISSTHVVAGLTAWVCPFVCCSMSVPSVVILAAHDLLWHLQ